MDSILSNMHSDDLYNLFMDVLAFTGDRYYIDMYKFALHSLIKMELK